MASYVRQEGFWGSICADDLVAVGVLLFSEAVRVLGPVPAAYGSACHSTHSTAGMARACVMWESTGVLIASAAGPSCISRSFKASGACWAPH